MPCYRLFCLAKPGLGRDQQAAVIRTAATSILDGGGVLMDLRSFGEKALAYVVRPAGQAFDEAHMWQLLFHSSPQVLQPLNHGLKVDERVIRYMLQKHSIKVPKPTTSVVSRWASTILDEEYKDKVSAAQQQGQPLWWDQIQPPSVPLQTPKPLSELFPEGDQADSQDSTSEAPGATDPAVEASAPSTDPQPSVPASDMSPDAMPEDLLQAQAPLAVTAEAATPPKVK